MSPSQGEIRAPTNDTLVTILYATWEYNICLRETTGMGGYSEKTESDKGRVPSANLDHTKFCRRAPRDIGPMETSKNYHQWMDSIRPTDVVCAFIDGSLDPKTGWMGWASRMFKMDSNDEVTICGGCHRSSFFGTTNTGLSESLALVASLWSLPRCHLRLYTDSQLSLYNLRIGLERPNRPFLRTSNRPLTRAVIALLPKFSSQNISHIYGHRDESVSIPHQRNNAADKLANHGRMLAQRRDRKKITLCTLDTTWTVDIHDSLVLGDVRRNIQHHLRDSATTGSWAKQQRCGLLVALDGAYMVSLIKHIHKSGDHKDSRLVQTLACNVPSTTVLGWDTPRSSCHCCGRMLVDDVFHFTECLRANTLSWDALIGLEPILSPILPQDLPRTVKTQTLRLLTETTEQFRTAMKISRPATSALAWTFLEISTASRSADFRDNVEHVAALCLDDPIPGIGIDWSLLTKDERKRVFASCSAQLVIIADLDALDSPWDSWSHLQHSDNPVAREAGEIRWRSEHPGLECLFNMKFLRKEALTHELWRDILERARSGSLVNLACDFKRTAYHNLPDEARITYRRINNTCWMWTIHMTTHPLCHKYRARRYRRSFDWLSRQPAFIFAIPCLGPINFSRLLESSEIPHGSKGLWKEICAMPGIA